jgi:hypothetical protein
MRNWYRIAEIAKAALGVLVIAALFAFVGVSFGVIALTGALLALALLFGLVWWLTERSDTTFGRGFREWRSERRSQAIRAEAETIAEEKAEEAARRHAASLQAFAFFT